MKTYPHLFIGLHWLMALIILVMLLVGEFMTDLPKDNPLKMEIYGLHKAAGAVVLMLVVLRMLAKARMPRFPAEPNTAMWQQLLADMVHLALYLAMFAIPLSGWLMSNAAGYPVSVFGMFNLPTLVQKGDAIGALARQVHGWALPMFAVLVGLHVAGAAKHWALNKDNTIYRMLPLKFFKAY